MRAHLKKRSDSPACRTRELVLPDRSTLDVAPAKVLSLLVPFDFTEQSAIGVEYAKKIAVVLPVRVELLHVIDIGMYLGDSLYSPGTYHVSVNELTRELQRVQIGSLKDTPCHCQVVEGVPYKEIIRRAREMKADAIIIGSRRHRELSSWLHRKTAERVVRFAPCTVVIARAPPQSGSLKKRRRREET